MDSVYIKAALVQPPKIAGIQLRPFSLWHALMLLQLDNPVMLGNIGVADAGDIAQALLVCRDGFSGSGNLRSLLKYTNSPWRQWLMAWRLGRYGPQGASDHFFRYVDAYRESPEYWPAKSQKHSRILGPFRVAGTLINHTTLGEDRVWNMPYGLAYCYQACIAEDNGANLVSEDELRQADAAIEQREADDGRSQSKS